MWGPHSSPPQTSSPCYQILGMFLRSKPAVFSLGSHGYSHARHWSCPWARLKPQPGSSAPRPQSSSSARSTVSTWICCPQPGDLRQPMGFSSPWLPDLRNEITRTLISEACTAKHIGKIMFPYSQLDDFRQVIESLVSLFPFDLPWQWRGSRED